MNSPLMAIELFRWWYGQGWKLMVKASARRLASVNEMFSVSTLLHTLFAPWRRIITYPGAGIDAHIRAMMDNLVSRLVGMAVRLIVLFSAAVMLIITLAIGFLQIVVWPLVPLLAIAALVKGLM